jgi:hypothetical protein
MSTIKVFKYSMGWTWVCSSCGVGHTSAQWSVWDKQPAALSAALRHCREARLR